MEVFHRNIFRKVSLYILAVLFSTNLLAELEIPKQLQKDVNFWEKIFSVVSDSQCVLHDPVNLDVVYGIVNLPPKKSKKMRKDSVERSRDRISQKLRVLAEKVRTGSGLLESWEKNLISIVGAEEKVESEIILRFSERVRCQLGVKDEFEKSLVRSQKYLPMIKSMLKARGLPLDLAYLPHLESSFNIKAHSKVGARGLWQLMPATARQGMVVSRKRDDRLNPYISTRFAIRILEENFQRVQSWPLAMTGYNYGINGIVRAVKKLGSNDYLVIREEHNSRSFGFAARNFYPSFIAARNLAKRYERGEGIFLADGMDSIVPRNGKKLL